MALIRHPQFVAVDPVPNGNKYLSKLTIALLLEGQKPGELAPKSGIYRCLSCGYEAVSSENEPLPPQHSECSNTQWILTVEAKHKTPE